MRPTWKSRTGSTAGMPKWVGRDRDRRADEHEQPHASAAVEERGEQQHSGDADVRRVNPAGVLEGNEGQLQRLGGGDHRIAIGDAARTGGGDVVLQSSRRSRRRCRARRACREPPGRPASPVSAAVVNALRSSPAVPGAASAGSAHLWRSCCRANSGSKAIASCDSLPRCGTPRPGAAGHPRLPRRGGGRLSAVIPAAMSRPSSTSISRRRSAWLRRMRSMRPTRASSGSRQLAWNSRCPADSPRESRLRASSFAS